MGSFFVNLRTVEEREGQEGPVRKQDKGDMRRAGWGSIFFIFFFLFFLREYFMDFILKE